VQKGRGSLKRRKKKKKTNRTYNADTTRGELWQGFPRKKTWEYRKKDNGTPQTTTNLGGRPPGRRPGQRKLPGTTRGGVDPLCNSVTKDPLGKPFPGKKKKKNFWGGKPAWER